MYALAFGTDHTIKYSDIRLKKLIQLPLFVDVHQTYSSWIMLGLYKLFYNIKEQWKSTVCQKYFRVEHDTF